MKMCVSLNHTFSKIQTIIFTENKQTNERTNKQTKLNRSVPPPFFTVRIKCKIVAIDDNGDCLQTFIFLNFFLFPQKSSICCSNCCESLVKVLLCTTIMLINTIERLQKYQISKIYHLSFQQYHKWSEFDCARVIVSKVFFYVL